MKAVLQHISDRQARFAEHPFFEQLREERPLEQALAFAPRLAFWVMSFQDVLLLTGPRGALTRGRCAPPPASPWLTRVESWTVREPKGFPVEVFECHRRVHPRSTPWWGTRPLSLGRARRYKGARQLKEP